MFPQVHILFSGLFDQLREKIRISSVKMTWILYYILICSARSDIFNLDLCREELRVKLSREYVVREVGNCYPYAV